MISAITIKIPHKLEGGEVQIVEHFLVALAAKPKKLGVTIFAQTLCGWAGPIKESEFKVHYRFSNSDAPLPQINCGACYDATVGDEDDEDDDSKQPGVYESR